MKIGMVGFGHVGEAFYKLLKNHQVTAILVKNKDKKRPDVIQHLLTYDVDDFFNKGFDLLVEVSAHAQPAADIIKRALHQQIHVITANKAAIALNFYQFQKLAEENHVACLFEASTLSGMPVINTIQNLVQTDQILSIHGIVNGSTNFCLSKIFNEDYTLEQAIIEATERGFLEADPKDDLDGYDQARKCLILSNIAYGADLTLEDIDRYPLSKITEKMVAFIKYSSLKLKYIIVSEKYGNNLVLKVEPVAFGSSLLMNQINEEKNIVYINTLNRGPVIIIGLGAGGIPTASGLLADLSLIENGHYRYFNKNIDNDFSVIESTQKFDYFVETKDSLIEVKNVSATDLKSTYKDAVSYVRVKR